MTLEEILAKLATDPDEVVRRLWGMQSDVEPDVRARWERMAAAGNRRMQTRVEQLDALDAVVAAIEAAIDGQG